MTKGALLARIEADRARFDRTVARVPPERLADPILPGDWSVKDVLAHVAWGEREAIGVIQKRALVGSDLWDLPEDDRNAAVVEKSRSRQLDDILREYRTTFDEYVAAIGQLSDAELNDPERIRGLDDGIPGWRPWRVLYDPGHYGEHGRTIAAALRDLAPR